MGLADPTYFSGFCPFLNWWKAANFYFIDRHDKPRLEGLETPEAAQYFDDHGNVKRQAPADLKSISRIFYALPPRNYQIGHSFAGMRWGIAWDGAAKCTISGISEGGSQTINSAKGSGSFIFGAKPDNTWATFEIVDRNNPPRNIRVYQMQYAANVEAGEMFNPDWIAQIRAFGRLRFMSWMGTSNSGVRDLSQVPEEEDHAWCIELPGSGVGPYGGKGGVPLTVIAKLANLTSCDVQICIPHQATDDCVRAMAETLHKLIAPNIVITFEYSNECWNWQFEQTRYCDERAQSEGLEGGPPRWYGRRAAECMDIVADVIGDRQRWQGCLAVQTVNLSVTETALQGVQDHLNRRASTKSYRGRVADLFDEISVTGYFGDVVQSRPIENISNALPAVVSAPGHGYSNGQKLRLFVQSGMVELNNVNVTVANAGPDTFELANLDTRRFAKFEAVQNYAAPADIFNLMDQSEADFAAQRDGLKSRYQKFNRIMAKSWLSGEADGIVTEVSVAALKARFWPQQLALAKAHGLALRQYEGGLHFVGDAHLVAFGGNPQFTDFLIHIGHSAETAEVYREAYQAFTDIGGTMPAKYVEAGNSSQYGTWSGMRFLPGDERNPVWEATRKFNDG